MSDAPPVLLEVCVGSVADAVTAERHGANCVELCSALSLGGLTPSYGAVVETRRRVRLPIVAMLRPQSGAFQCDDADFAAMLADAEQFAAAGVDGLVFGLLDDDGCVDVPRCRRLIEQCGACHVVFHRAFDAVPDPHAALEQLIELGFTRVLTSGQRPTAIEGAELIAELQRQAGDRIEILPGGGVRAENVAELLARTGCRQAHASCRKPASDSSSGALASLRLGGAADRDDALEVTDGAAVERLVQAIAARGSSGGR